MNESPLIEVARKIGQEVTRLHADDVDANSRFPVETIDALKSAGLLGAYVPKSLGGMGASLRELCGICEALGRHCTTSAMIFAMHQIQVITIVHHAMDSEWFRAYLADLARYQYLIASVTSEVGVGGEMRTSRCAVEADADGRVFKLIKDATTISYGAQADDLLVSARKGLQASGNDQVLVLVRKTDYTLEKKGVWNSMGMRGTCSPPFLMTSRGEMNQVMTVPFSDMAAQTVVPVSHLLWAHTWTGNVTAAANKAAAFVRGQARANPGAVPPTALRLAELSSMLQRLRTSIGDCLTEYEFLRSSGVEGAEKLSSVGYAIKINNLKIDASESLPEIVGLALRICGILGYKNDSPFAMSRHLRDSHSSILMVGNDRMYATNANLLLVVKDF
jgi:acyl-CoA dehydrogenase